VRVLVTGSSGLVGSALVPLLASSGSSITRLVRRTPGPGEISWDPAAGEIDAARIEGFDAVVHLAGENIALRRWNAATKARIHHSRVLATRLLAETLAGRVNPPRVFVCASAIGYYGDRAGVTDAGCVTKAGGVTDPEGVANAADEELTESSPPGRDFLAGLCREWEAASKTAEEAGIRVVRLRIGMVLSPRGGALAKMLPLFRLGVGGVLGSGRQYMSWIAIDDLVAIIRRAINDEELSGPVNAVSPNPVTNREFTRTLASVLSRPAIIPAPAFVLRAALGEMADALLLSSQRVIPARLAAAGFSWRFPDLRGALSHVLGC
jgi:NAD dependent epimerase/dehydratase family enzyme